MSNSIKYRKLTIDIVKEALEEIRSKSIVQEFCIIITNSKAYRASLYKEILKQVRNKSITTEIDNKE